MKGKPIRPRVPQLPKEDSRGIRSTETRMWAGFPGFSAVKTEKGWGVSWLPGRDDLTREQARDALELAGLSRAWLPRPWFVASWPKIQRLAKRIDVNPTDAVRLARQYEKYYYSQKQQIPSWGADGRMRVAKGDYSQDFPEPMCDPLPFDWGLER